MAAVDKRNLPGFLSLQVGARGLWGWSMGGSLRSESGVCTSPRLPLPQLAIDRWAINAPLPVADLDPAALMDLFVAELSLLGPSLQQARTALASLNASDPAAYASLVANATAWLGASEAYAPQSVDFLPFPFTAFFRRPFYGILIPLFAFFFLFTVSAPRTCLAFPPS